MADVAQDRSKLKEDLIFKLGGLIRPLQDLVDNPQLYDDDEQNRIRARFEADLDKFYRDIVPLFDGEKGHTYEWLRMEYVRARLQISRKLQAPINEIKEALSKFKEEAINAIQAVPVAKTSMTFEAQTPYSAYCAIRDIVATSGREVVVTDRYVDYTLFHRYLRDINEKVQVAVVTWPETKQIKQRFKEFLDVSRLYAIERGPQRYRLVTNENFHDRHLRVDGRVYHIGASLKDAAITSACTLSVVDPPNSAEIDKLLGEGTELFGPNSLTHP